MPETIHDIVIVGVPTAAILGGFLFQGRRFERLEDKVDKVTTDLRSEINAFRSEVNARFDKMHSDLHTFFSLTGEWKGRIDTLEKRH